MFLFRGELSGDSLRYMRITKIKIRVIFVMGLVIFGAIPVTCFAFAVSYWCYWVLIIFFIMGLISVFMDLSDLPVEVRITEDYVTGVDKKGRKSCYGVNEILEIIDMGTWYRLKFNLKLNPNIVCQKDLLVEGTLDEFEEIFKDKLVVYEPKKRRK